MDSLLQFEQWMRVFHGARSAAWLPPNVVDLEHERRKRAPPSRAWLRENGYLPPVRVLLAVPVEPPDAA